jgi:hypothetical protein
MILVLRPWPTRLLAFAVAVVTLGLVRLDVPHVPHVRRMRFIRRWWTMHVSRWHGRRDGRLGIPVLTEEISPPEVWKLKQQADAVVRGIAARWAGTDARLLGEREAMVRTIAAVDDEVTQRERELMDVTREYDETRHKLIDMKGEDEKRQVDDRWRIPSWFYILAITVVFAGEFPLNAVAFNLFGDDRWLTYAMTAGLAAVLVFCAHSLGILTRLKKISDRDLVVTVLVAFIPVAAIVSIGVVRERYLEAQGAAGVGLAVLGSMTGIVIFITMNLVIYVGAFSLSYLHHDPHGELIARVRREMRRAQRAVRRKQRELDRFEHLRRWLETKIALWEGGRAKSHRAASFQAKRHKDIFEAAIAAYWGSNRVAKERSWKRDVRRAKRRGGPEAKIPASLDWPPVCFAKTPEVSIPEEFTVDFDPDVLLNKQRKARRRVEAQAAPEPEPA